MAVGSRVSPRTPGLATMADALEAAAETSPAIASELEALAQDSVAAMRAMIEHGTTEERIAVFKALSPLILKLNSANDGTTTELDAAAQARAMLMGAWEGLG